MDLTQAARWRNYAGKAGALFALLAMLSVVDGLIARFREPADVIKVLPGESANLNGPLGEEVRGVQDLTYTSDSEHLTLTFAALHKGYFLGGAMWQGQLHVSPRIPPGEYRLSVMALGKTSPRPPQTFRIQVYADPVSRQEHAKSLWRRYAGVSPWLAAAFCLPGILLSFGGVFLLSQKMEALLLQMGQAEVYRVVKGEGDYLISFGLGTAHGLKAGATLTLFDPEGHPVGQVEVLEVSATDAAARISTEREIKPGFIVAL